MNFDICLLEGGFEVLAKKKEDSKLMNLFDPNKILVLVRS